VTDISGMMFHIISSDHHIIICCNLNN